MKKQLLFIGLALAVSSTTFAQKKNVTDAALRINKLNLNGKYDSQLALANEAKSFIDLAAVNVETINDPNMHFYRAKTYLGLELLDVNNKIFIDTTFASCIEFKNLKYYAESFNELDKFDKVPENKSKSKLPDLKSYTLEQINLIYNKALDNFNDKKYLSSAQQFSVCANVLEILKIDGELYEDAKINFLVAINNHFQIDRANKPVELNFEYSKNILKCQMSNDLVLNTIDYGLELINRIQSSIEKTKSKLVSTTDPKEKTLKQQEIDSLVKERAELGLYCVNLLEQGVALDSGNKQLPYLQGYISFLLENYNLSFDYASKAFQIDNNYVEALYIMGLSKTNQAVILNNELLSIDWKNPKYNEVENAAKLKFSESLVPFEKMIAINPNSKDALDNLYRNNMKLGNIDKAQEYKKRLDALKN